jgi:hypothetical protein
MQVRKEPHSRPTRYLTPDAADSVLEDVYDEKFVAMSM